MFAVANEADYFGVVFVVALVLTRVGVYLWVYYLMNYLGQPAPQTIIFGFRTHHYMYGIVLAILGVLFKNVTLYAIGMALFVDELTFALVGIESHEANYSLLSNLGTLFFGVLVYVFRERVLFF